MNPQCDESDAFLQFRKRSYFLLFLALAALFAVYHFHLVLMGFASVLIAVIFRGLAVWLFDRMGWPARHEKVRYGLALSAVVLAILGVLVGLGFMVGVPFAEQFLELKQSVLQGWANLKEQLREYGMARSVLAEIPSLKEAISTWSDEIYGAFSGLFGILGAIGVVLVIGLYLSIGSETYINGILALIPQRKKPRAAEILDTTGHALRYWTIGRFASMAATGILTGLGLWIIGVPLPLSLGVIVGLSSFVPIVGTIAGSVPGILLAFTQSLDLAIYATIVYVVVQILEGNLITPLVQYRTVSLPPVILIGSQTLLGTLVGIAGVVFATPLAVTTMVLVQMAFVKDALGNPVSPLGQKNKLRQERRAAKRKRQEEKKRRKQQSRQRAGTRSGAARVDR